MRERMPISSEAEPSHSIDVVAAAKNLVPVIVAARAECERDRRVPAEIAEALAAGGLFQMFLPRSMGGPELPPLTVFRAIEELSRADGSVGWCYPSADRRSTMATRLSESGPSQANCSPTNARAAANVCRIEDQYPQRRATSVAKTITFYLDITLPVLNHVPTTAVHDEARNACCAWLGVVLPKT